MKIFVLIICIILMFNTAFAVSPADNLSQYLDKTYVGMEYNTALNQDIPFLLIFASPCNAFIAVKLFPIAEMVYDKFNGQYNFCIINASKDENKEIIDLFSPSKLPAVYLIDTKNRTYTFIDKKYYNKKAIYRILTRFKDGTLF